MAEQAVNVIYKLAEHPDLICGDMLKQLAQKVMASGHSTTATGIQLQITPSDNIILFCLKGYVNFITSLKHIKELTLGFWFRTCQYSSDIVIMGLF